MAGREWLAGWRVQAWLVCVSCLVYLLLACRLTVLVLSSVSRVWARAGQERYSAPSAPSAPVLIVGKFAGLAAAGRQRGVRR